MKALSIQQPWAWLIVNGYKHVENRTWPTKYRGEFLIHAGKKKDADGFIFAQERGVKYPVDDSAMHLIGGIVGIGEIVDCVTMRDDPWFFGPYGFVIQNARPLPFRPLRGMLGFFEVPAA